MIVEEHWRVKSVWQMDRIKKWCHVFSDLKNKNFNTKNRITSINKKWVVKEKMPNKLK